MSNMEDKLDRLICERVTVEKGHCRYTTTILLPTKNRKKIFSKYFDMKDKLIKRNNNKQKG